MKLPNMKLPKTTLAFAVLLAGTSARIYAQGNAQAFAPGLDMPLTISASAVIQAPDTSNDAGNLTKSTTKTAKLTTASILHDAGAPAGSKLLWQSGSGQVIIVDKTGAPVSSGITLTITADSSSGVWTGTSDTDSGAASYSGIFPITVSYDDGTGSNLTLTGLATEKYTISKADPNSVKPQTLTDSVSMNLSGTGSRAGEVGVLTGTLKASGKGAIFP